MMLGTTSILRSLTWQLGQAQRSLVGDATVGILASALWVAVRAQYVPRVQRSFAIPYSKTCPGVEPKLTAAAFHKQFPREKEVKIFPRGIWNPKRSPTH